MNPTGQIASNSKRNSFNQSIGCSAIIECLPECLVLSYKQLIIQPTNVFLNSLFFTTRLLNINDTTNSPDSNQAIIITMYSKPI
jgi:hypothetical protein